MKITSLVPPAEGSAPFDLYWLRRLPELAGCYCLTNSGGDILYVGQAMSLRRRLEQHFDSDKRQALTIYGRVSLAHWRREVEERLNSLERGWIERVRLYDGDLPPLNRVGGPVG